MDIVSDSHNRQFVIEITDLFLARFQPDAPMGNEPFRLKVAHHHSKPQSPRFGVGRGGLPRFVPISPFSSDLFRFALLVFENTPMCSDLFLDLLRFLLICSDSFSEQIRTNQGNPFLATLAASPRTLNFLRGNLSLFSLLTILFSCFFLLISLAMLLFLFGSSSFFGGHYFSSFLDFGGSAERNIPSKERRVRALLEGGS